MAPRSHVRGEAQRRERVVIIGGGFAGLSAARGLSRAPVDVVLLDRLNYHCFQPLLYQVATSGLPSGVIAPPLRWVLRRQANARVLLAEVTDIDLQRRVVMATDAAGRERHERFDWLLLATGSRHAYFGNPQWEQVAPGLKTVDDALEIRRRVLGAFELAELAANDEELGRLTTFVIVGAGPTGVELAGQVAEMARRTLRDEYRCFDPTQVRTLLVDAADRPLVTYDAGLSRATERSLAELGVELRTSALITDVDEHGVTIGSGDDAERVEAATVIWAAGVEASPLGRTVARQGGADVDKAGRVVVTEHLTLPGDDRVFVLGDLAGTGSPGVAPVAMQQGRYAARQLRRRLEGRDAGRAFRYHDRGSMATIGRWRAVAQIGRLRFSGVLAWLTWLFVHLMFLAGFRNRVLTLASWFASFIGRSRGERALTGTQRGEESVGAARHLADEAGGNGSMPVDGGLPQAPADERGSRQSHVR